MIHPPARVAAGMLAAIVTLGLGAGGTAAMAQPDNTSGEASATLAQDGAPSYLSPVDVPAPDEGFPVFAHYMPSLPVSLDNASPAEDYYSRNYLNPNGEGGKFRSIGGLLRDRPIGRAPRDGDWELADLRSEVHDAAQAGISGFAVDVLETSGKNWERTKNLLVAAAAEDSRFKVMLQPDMTAGPANLSPVELADRMAELASSSAVYRSTNGRVVVSPFAGEAKDPGWWSQFNQAMAERGQPVDLMPVFVTVGNNIEAYASVSYGMGEWGSRTPGVVDASPDYAARAHALGKLWISPVGAQDVRPVAASFMEASNMGTLRSLWGKAIRTKADMALMVSWNDYSESTQFAPSVDHGYSLLSLNSYYLAEFRRRSAASIVRDAAYISYRVQPVAARPTEQSQVMQVSSVENAEPTDKVEIETILKEPAAVAFYTGGQWQFFHADAGVTLHSAPLGAGIVRVVVIRDGLPLVAEQSHQDVADSVALQDLAYHVVGTARP